MNAYTILGVSKNDSIQTIRKQYLLLALQFHPDKNKNVNANEQFLEIKQAYDWIVTNHSSPFLNEPDTGNNDYKSTMFRFLHTFNESYTNDLKMELIYNIIEKIQTLSDSPVLYVIIKNIIRKLRLDIETLQIIEHLFHKYGDVFHITNANIITVLRDLINEWEQNTIVLTPSLTDLFNEQVFVLDSYTEPMYIPLWHKELLYENPDLLVKISPQIPDNIKIDTNNDIYVFIVEPYSLLTIWERGGIYVTITEYINLFIPKDNIALKNTQTIIMSKMGIPKIQTMNSRLCDASQKSNLFITFSIQARQ